MLFNVSINLLKGCGRVFGDVAVLRGASVVHGGGAGRKRGTAALHGLRHRRLPSLPRPSTDYLPPPAPVPLPASTYHISGNFNTRYIHRDQATIIIDKIQNSTHPTFEKDGSCKYIVGRLYTRSSKEQEPPYELAGRSVRSKRSLRRCTRGS